MRLDELGQFGECFCLVKRVATGEGDISKRIGYDLLKNILSAHIRSATECPRLWVVALGTLMAASRTIDACAEAGSINSGIV